ncbi:MAG: hypothetical protein WA728_02145 [Xanthobacteraceae bacterium]
MSRSLRHIRVLPTTDGWVQITVRDSREASKVGRYWNALRHFLVTDDDSRLKAFLGKSIIDAKGREIPLFTDARELRRRARQADNDGEA